MVPQIGLPDLLSAALCPFLYIGGLQGGIWNNWGFRHRVTWLDGQLVLERTRAGWAENSKRGAQAWRPECMGSSASILDESPGLWSSALAVTQGHSQRPRSVPWPGVQNRPPPAVSVELLLRTVHFSAPRTPAVFTWPGHLNQSHLPSHTHVSPRTLGTALAPYSSLRPHSQGEHLPPSMRPVLLHGHVGVAPGISAEQCRNQDWSEVTEDLHEHVDELELSWRMCRIDLEGAF